MGDAVTGTTGRARKRRTKKRTPKRRTEMKDWQPGGIDHALLNDLPHPDLPPVGERMEPEVQQPEQPKGILATLAGAFSSKPKSAVSSVESPAPSMTSEPAAQLAPEAEAQLDRVPDVIGEEPIAIGPAEVVGESDASGIGALLDSVAFDEQDIQDTLEELFDYLAERFESDHWKLTARQSRMLGRPTAQLVNVLWAKLKLRLPDILGKWCEETPGATAFLMAFGLVVVPKGLTQLKLSKQRALRGDVPVQDEQPKPKTKPEPVKPNGSAPTLVGGIPVSGSED